MPLRFFRPLGILLALSCLLRPFETANARILVDPTQVVKESYDFVIVGAGTAGCVLANRLSESKTTKVLVIEAGISNNAVPDISVPFLGPGLTPDKPWTWNFTVSPQRELNNRTFPYPRGKVLGGSSSVNYMVYNRGARADYDRWANFTGDQGWSWDELQKFMKRNEKMVPPADNHNTSGQFLPQAHGFSGTLLTSLPGFPTGIDQRVLDATSQINGFEFNIDMNRGDETGIGWVYSSIGKSKRSSSATAYLTPDVLNRPNLDILIQTQVTKVFSVGKTNGLQSVRGVQFAQSQTSPTFNVTAKKEVILSGGSVGSPQVLLLSGIGDKNALNQLGIQSLIHIPGVGKNLQDHALLPNQFFVNTNLNSTFTWENFTQARNPVEFASVQAQYDNNGMGQLVNTICNHIGWLRVNDSELRAQGFDDPSAGAGAGQYELVFSNGFVGIIQPTPDTGNFMTVISNLVSPASRGSLTLASNSPWDQPTIDPGFLTAPVDLFLLRSAYKVARTFLSAPAFSDYILGPFGTAGASSDAEIDAYIRNFTTSVWHPVGTASMSGLDQSSSGVVSSKLLVNGLDGLRVVDASIMPFVPAAHTEAPVYYIAERGADLIKKKWNLH